MEWVNEISNVETVIGVATLMQLTMVELIDEQTTCVRQCIGTMRKALRRTG